MTVLRSAVHRLEDVIGAALFTAMLVVVLAQVFVRFLLYRWVQIAWADEIGRALLVWSSFWGAVLVTRENHHITVDLLYDRLTAAGQLILRVLGDLVTGCLLLLLVSQGFSIFVDSFVRRSPATELPSFIFDGALWTSSVLMVLHIALNAVGRWRSADTSASGSAL